MITITKVFEFEAAHWLPKHEGLCRKVHGHSYKLEVEVTKEISESSGMIMDFADLKKVVREVIIDKYDHQMLNDSFPNPTAEKMVLSFAEDLREEVEGIVRVRLWETSTSYAEWKR